MLEAEGLINLLYMSVHKPPRVGLVDFKRMRTLPFQGLIPDHIYMYFFREHVRAKLSILDTLRFEGVC